MAGGGLVCSYPRWGQDGVARACLLMWEALMLSCRSPPPCWQEVGRAELGRGRATMTGGGGREDLGPLQGLEVSELSCPPGPLVKAAHSHRPWGPRWGRCAQLPRPEPEEEVGPDCDPPRTCWICTAVSSQSLHGHLWTVCLETGHFFELFTTLWVS